MKMKPIQNSGGNDFGHQSQWPCAQSEKAHNEGSGGESRGGILGVYPEPNFFLRFGNFTLGFIQKSQLGIQTWTMSEFQVVSPCAGSSSCDQRQPGQTANLRASSEACYPALLQPIPAFPQRSGGRTSGRGCVGCKACEISETLGSMVAKTHFRENLLVAFPLVFWNK